MTIKVTIPGKVLVSGEHAVVYGEPAIVAAVDKKMEITIEKAEKFELVSRIEDKIGLVKLSLEKSGIDPERVRLRIKSDIPGGMGTSAALCAGVIGAAYEFKGKKLNKNIWHRLAWECEKKAHWNSSGVDPAAVIYKGLLWYVRGKELEQLKIFRSYKFVLVDSGKPEESTGEMVAGLAERAKNREIRRKISQIGQVTVKMRQKMEKGDDIDSLINENGILLEEMGLVGTKAKEMSQQLRAKGYGVKITGGGGVISGSGRLMVAGANLKLIKDWGYEAFEVVIGGR